MKKIRYSVAIILFWWVILYGTGVISNATFDVTEWTTASRLILSVGFLATAAIPFIVFNEIKK